MISRGNPRAILFHPRSSQLNSSSRLPLFRAAFGSVAALLLLLVCTAAQADGPTRPAGEVKSIAEQVFKGKGAVTAVEYLGYLGLYRVTINESNYMHITPDMKYAFVGDVIDISKGQSILYTPKPANFSALPLQDSIVKGNGPYKVAVFFDMKCPYCHKLYQELAELKDVTMYVYLVAFLGPESRSMAEAILSSEDRTKTLDDVVIRKAALPSGAPGDASILERNYKLAKSLNIRSTPTLIYSDGSVSVGYQPAGKIQPILASKGK